MGARMKPVSHKKKIAGVTVAIFDPIREQGLNVKTQPFEERPCILMVGNHLGDNFS
jgi:hypothetical protein